VIKQRENLLGIPFTPKDGGCDQQAGMILKNRMYLVGEKKKKEFL